MIHTLFRASIAQTSAASYGSGLRRFQAFLGEACQRLGLVPVPTDKAADLRELLKDPWVIGTFIATLHAEGLEAGTAQSYVQAIQHYATDLDGAAPPTHPAVSLLLRGFLSAGPPLKPKRPPVTLKLLEEMLGALPAFTNAYEAKLLTAVFTLAFYGCFRVSEYLTSSDPGKCLLRRDISASESGALVISSKKSKTRQRAHAQSVIFPQQLGLSCPVTAMAAFLGVRPATLGQDTPLFYSFAHHGPLMTLSDKQLNSVLKRLLRHMAVPNAEAFSSHSFRIGASTEAASRGASLAELQALGRWSSLTALTYVNAEVGQAMAARARARFTPRDASG